MMVGLYNNKLQSLEIICSNSLILIGGGGHCASCIDVVEQKQKYRIAGIVEKDEIKSEKLLGYSYIGTDKMLEFFNK